MTAENSGDPIQARIPTQCDSVDNPPTGSWRARRDREEKVESEHVTAAPSCPDTQRPIDQWLTQYSRYHQNALNKQIHFVCVPLIVLSILGILWSIPVPLQVTRLGPWFNAATLVVLLTTIYYTRLAPRLAIGMLILASGSLLLLGYAEHWIGIKAWQWAIPLFIFAWVGQFIGHHLEGKLPAFANDLQFLLIGPLWILADLYRRVGIFY